MNRPYMNALKRPAAGVDEPFMKKEMVIGTIGKTHGVNSIAKPQRMASRMSPQMEPPAFCDSSVTGSPIVELWPASSVAAAVAGARSFSENSQSSGIPQFSSSQLDDVITPSNLPADSVRRTF